MLVDEIVCLHAMGGSCDGAPCRRTRSSSGGDGEIPGLATRDHDVQVTKDRRGDGGTDLPGGQSVVGAGGQVGEPGSAAGACCG